MNTHTELLQKFTAKESLDEKVYLCNTCSAAGRLFVGWPAWNMTLFFYTHTHTHLACRNPSSQLQYADKTLSISCPPDVSNVNEQATWSLPYMNSSGHNISVPRYCVSTSRDFAGVAVIGIKLPPTSSSPSLSTFNLSASPPCQEWLRSRRSHTTIITLSLASFYTMGWGLPQGITHATAGMAKQVSLWC